jgi:hypothetical protein
MAKKYMGEGDPVLDALYEELDATGRKTRADRKKRRQLEREIRKIRAGRLGGIKGLFRNLSLRKYPIPASATAAASTLGLGEAIGEAIGEAETSFQPRAEVPETVAVPEIEEIEVTAERRPEIVEDQWVPWKSLMRVSKQRELPVGTFSKKNQRYNPETRQWEIRVLPELMNEAGYAHGGTLTGQADRLSRAGRGDDTMLMHVTPDEVQGLASLAPGMMTINPETGLPEAGWFRNLLGTAAPFLMAMIPGIGPLAAGALGGATGSLIKGGDLKDAMLGGITGLAGGALMKGLSGAGAQTAGLEDLMGGADVSALENIVNPEQFTELGSLVGSDAMNVGDALSSLNISKSGIMESLGDMPYKEFGGKGILGRRVAEAPWNKPFEQMSFGERMAGIKGGGLGGLTDQLMTLPGLGTIAGTGLQATRESQRMFEEGLREMEEARKRREDAYYQMYPENIPYAGGGSIYKNRYINGNWS